MILEQRPRPRDAAQVTSLQPVPGISRRMSRQLTPEIRLVQLGSLLTSTRFDWLRFEMGVFDWTDLNFPRNRANEERNRTLYEGNSFRNLFTRAAGGLIFCRFFADIESEVYLSASRRSIFLGRTILRRRK